MNWKDIKIERPEGLGAIIVLTNDDEKYVSWFENGEWLGVPDHTKITHWVPIHDFEFGDMNKIHNEVK